MTGNGTSTHADVFARCMGPVALELLGEPTERNKSDSEWRWGSRGSFMVLPQKGVFQDHAAGVTGGVLALLQRERNLDKPEALAWLRERGHLPNETPSRPVKRRQVAAYGYLDATGGLAFQVVRYNPKEFRQRRPDGAGGWHWNAQGVEPVLYRLPDVLEAVSIGRGLPKRLRWCSKSVPLQR